MLSFFLSTRPRTGFNHKLASFFFSLKRFTPSLKAWNHEYFKLQRLLAAHSRRTYCGPAPPPRPRPRGAPPSAPPARLLWPGAAPQLHGNHHVDRCRRLWGIRSHYWRYVHLRKHQTNGDVWRFRRYHQGSLHHYQS